PHPSHVILLTADAFGVMPPVARLSTAQALYHFLSGYTSKLAGTEVGLTEPEATFSSCYGAPFMALNPTVYADLLAERLDATGAEVWLINTGWVGGGYGIGERIAIKETRKMVRAVLNGTLDGVEMRHDPVFGFDVPTSCPGVDSHLLNPREMWPDKAAYDEVYTNLADKFSKNFEQFRPLVTQAVTEAGP
ncbi:MAG: phosphoenolpyruvate carboxykinase (ATP), partial [Dehalococcoidia bacterium]|nr:phosphoenolpyruvate carboxykinase (ATP) [Dehalococcoidia bacterium]